ncbi:Rap/ran-GAP family protein [Aphelenchoides avenae]|nr:Rap/ran-GAP family protein [Aphelenchus avenae]
MASPSEIPGTSAERFDSPGSSPSVGRRIQHANASGTNQFLRFFFRTRDDSRNIQNFISSEGSITQTAWNGISRNSPLKVRLKTVETLQEVVTKRRLQVSTLEGIWTETRDMLDIEPLRTPFLSLMIAITTGQIEEIGLALRKSFFETMVEMGLEEMSLRWLRALTVEGRSIEPFEFAVGELLAKWLEQAVEDEENVLTEQIVKLCDGLICANSAYVDEASLVRIIRTCCRCLCQRTDSVDLVGATLSCLEAVLKYKSVASATWSHLTSPV